MRRPPVRRYLVCALVQTTLILATPPPAGTQMVNRRAFTATTGGEQVECSFRARDDLSSQLGARTFIARPPRHALSFSVIAPSGMGTVMVSAQAIDDRLETASQFLQQNNGGSDVSCCFEITRAGAVATFAEPAGMVGGVIANATDLANVFAIGADVKIVAAINFCGSGTPPFAGCQSGNSLIVTPGFAAFTLAHELGHRQGLCHVGTNCTPDCGQAGNCTGCDDPSASNIMWFRRCTPPVPPAQDRITVGQCSSYRQGATP